MDLGGGTGWGHGPPTIPKKKKKKEAVIFIFFLNSSPHSLFFLCFGPPNLLLGSVFVLNILEI
jgi:hypothetical protein